MASSDEEPRYTCFSEPDSTTDVIFIVEEKLIHFCKTLLVVSSPVFARMFSSAFREKEAETIPLPEKSYTEFEVFLKQLHPVYSWIPLKDYDLESLLKLSDEYDVSHIKKKCSHHIKSQLKVRLSVDQSLRYLWLCMTYKLTDIQELALTRSADHSLSALEKNLTFSKLDIQTQLELTKNRCRLLENNESPPADFDAGLITPFSFLLRK